MNLLGKALIEVRRELREQGQEKLEAEKVES